MPDYGPFCMPHFLGGLLLLALASGMEQEIHNSAHICLNLTGITKNWILFKILQKESVLRILDHPVH
jgi:hypothetical protein